MAPFAADPSADGHPDPGGSFAGERPGSEATAVIVTPAGSTIRRARDGGYRICDRHHHCRRADNLWQAQQMVQWAEVHHLHLDSPEMPTG